MSRFNPHFPHATNVFDAAAKFKQRCLLDQQSLLLDGQTLWTTEHFQALIDNYVKQPDVGQGGLKRLTDADPLWLCLEPYVVHQP